MTVRSNSAYEFSFQIWLPLSSVERTANPTALPGFVADQPLQNDPLMVVTHEVTVTTLTGVFPNSGARVVAPLEENGESRDFARVSFDK